MRAYVFLNDRETYTSADDCAIVYLTDAEEERISHGNKLEDVLAGTSGRILPFSSPSAEVYRADMEQAMDAYEELVKQITELTNGDICSPVGELLMALAIDTLSLRTGRLNQPIPVVRNKKNG